MSKRDEPVSFKDMLNHASEAVDLLGNLCKEELKESRIMQLALTRLMEITGEAANRISSSTKKENPDIPWEQIIGMRNRLIHGYDVIDYDLLWDTVNYDLPPLINSIKKIIKK
ncbi:MAG: HepT-like ribonuclease domain-containing protein [Candidatus Aminicenantes bacterium]